MAAAGRLKKKGRPSGGLLLLAPFFILLALFYIVPLCEGVLMSLHSHTATTTGPYVGSANYRSVFTDGRYWQALSNTGIYLVASIIVVLPLATLLAHLLSASWRRLRPLLTLAMLAPGLTPPSVLAILFLLVFYGRYGILNRAILMPLGLPVIQWLKDPHWIMTALVLQCIWRWTGILTFFLLAALDAAPKDQCEAARLDGAGAWATAWHVTIPFLRPVLLFLGLYLAVDAIALFAGSWLLLGGSGGTADAGLLLVSYVHQQAFPFGRFGVAAAAALSVAPMLLGMLALLVWRFGRERRA